MNSSLEALPLIVGMGGINAAGRTTHHDAFGVLVSDQLENSERLRVLEGTANLMNLPIEDGYEDKIRQRIGVRKIDPSLIDTQNLTHHQPFRTNRLFDLELLDQHRLSSEQLLELASLKQTDSSEIKGYVRLLYKLGVSYAAQFPTGFDCASLYPARHHPRGLQAAIFSASEAVASLGVPWEKIEASLPPDRMGVFASSSLGQLDQYAMKGMMNVYARGQRVTSKHLPFSYPQMISDFISAYVIGNVGNGFGAVGACASFAYNLFFASEAIRKGRLDLAIVSTSDAPIVPDLIEAFNTMGAIANDKKLQALRLQLGDLNAMPCRPFGENIGFVMGESAQAFVLVSPQFAFKMGLPVLGSVPGVFCHADGFKKSISAPGAGNYLSFMKAASQLKQLLSDQESVFVFSHGTGTPQNRITESKIISRVARNLELNLPVTSIKGYLGHSQGSACADQMAFALSSFHYGIMSGIQTTDVIAPDVSQENIRFLLEHEPMTASMQRGGTILNAKGFGGNNASCVVLSPARSKTLLTKRYGKTLMQNYEKKCEESMSVRLATQEAARRGEYQMRYLYDHQVLDDQDVVLGDQSIQLGEKPPISLEGIVKGYEDMLKED